MSKYAALADHLRSLSSLETRLSFADIEALIGGPLPESARKHRRWWGNSRTADSHTWAHLWLAAGWEQVQLDLEAGWVAFRRTETYAIDAPEAREGYEIDRRILARGRNSHLAAERKRMDNYTCQACGFWLQVDGHYVIEVHHHDPLSSSGERTTTLQDLVSLCPTCHRIAHLRAIPYDTADIRALRNTGSEGARLLA